MPENRIEKKYLKLICTFKATDLFSKASLTAAPVFLEICSNKRGWSEVSQMVFSML